MQTTRITRRFDELKARGDRALICYVVAGDPSMEQTVEIIHALDDAGVDAIEVGIPFSDPLADGPSIQAAGHRALERGASVSGVFETLRTVRRTSDVPVVIMTYFNPALRYGLERFAFEAAEAGADGVIQTDLTPEESREWLFSARSAGLDTIFLLAPTSTPERIQIVSRTASGFVYCVSRTGVTGARSDVPADLMEFVSRVRSGLAAEERSLPVCVGFGISLPEHVSRICAFADGVVVGSALVDLIAKNADSSRLVSEVRQYAIELKGATRAE